MSFGTSGQRHLEKLAYALNWDRGCRIEPLESRIHLDSLWEVKIDPIIHTDVLSTPNVVTGAISLPTQVTTVVSGGVTKSITLTTSIVEASSWQEAVQSLVTGSWYSSASPTTFSFPADAGQYTIDRAKNIDGQAPLGTLGNDYVGEPSVNSLQQVIAVEENGPGGFDSDKNDAYWLLVVKHYVPQAPSENDGGDGSNDNHYQEDPPEPQKGTPTSNQTPDPVVYGDGSSAGRTTDLTSSGFAGKLLAGRVDPPNIGGIRTIAFSSMNPELSVFAPGTSDEVIKIKAAGSYRYDIVFDIEQGTTWYSNFSGGSLTHDTLTHEYIWSDSHGGKTSFYDFDSSVPVDKFGKPKIYTTPSGKATEYKYDSGTHKLAATTRSVGTSGTLVSESISQQYVSGGVNDGLVSSISLDKLNELNEETAPTSERTVEYEYYESSDPNGLPGDIKFAVTKDKDGNILETSYFRYYITAPLAHLQKYMVSGAAFSRLNANYSDVESATDGQIAPYSNSYYEYDFARRVTAQVVAGFGSSEEGGQGVYTFEYISSDFAPDPNAWSVLTHESQPDLTQNYVYTNAYGAVMLKVSIGTNGYVQSADYYRYDDSMRVIMHANTSAIGVGSEPEELQQYADLLNEDGGNLEFLNDDTGLIETFTYFDDTDLGEGEVKGYKSGAYIRQGEVGSPITQRTWTYSQSPSGLRTVVASETVYANDNETGARATLYDYTWHLDTEQYEFVTVTRTAATSAQNGPDGTFTEQTYFDEFGRPTWHMDADGFISHKTYDLATGAILISIQDVDDQEIEVPDGWETPSGAGLHLVTEREVDAFGRTIKLTRPNGTVELTSYNDPNHEWRRYEGFNGTSNTGPITISREYRPAPGSEGIVYHERLTSSADAEFDDDVPHGDETIDETNIKSLVRSLTNASGQTVEVDSYFSFEGITYTTADARLGTDSNDSSSGNYHVALTGYGPLGRIIRQENSAGTITRTVYDERGFVSSVWTGTDDTPSLGLWTPDNTQDTDLVKVVEYRYDTGTASANVQVGDGNLTRVTTYLDNVGYPRPVTRKTYNVYDWRNRLVMENSGYDAAAAASAQTPWMQYEYNNVGEVVSTTAYNTLSPQSTSGVPKTSNSGFETPSLSPNTYQYTPAGASWTFTGNSGITGDDSGFIPPSPWEGQQAAFIQYGGSISKSISGWAVGRYTISFVAAHRTPEVPDLPINVLVDNVVVGTFTPNTWSYEAFTTQPFEIDSSGSHTIEFESSNDTIYGDAFIDAVEINVARGGTTIEYDEQGRVFAQHAQSVDPATGEIASNTLDTQSWYDLRGNVIKSSAPGGLVSKIFYDGAGRAVKAFESDGRGDSLYSDASTVDDDHVLTQAEYEYDDNGNVISILTRSRYDNATDTGELGDSSSSSGTAKARLSYTRKYYDAANRLTANVNIGDSISEPSVRQATDEGTTTTLIDSSLSTPYSNVTLVVIDGAGAGQQAVVTGVSAGTITLGSELSVPTDSTSKYIILDDGELSTSYSYDDAGQVAVTTNPGMQKSSTLYDMLGRPIAQISNYVDGTPSDADDQTVKYSYNGNGSILTMTADLPGTDQVTKYVYGAMRGTGSDIDSNDILTEIWYPDPTDGSASSSEKEEFTVNRVGDRTTYTDRNGTVHTYKYDVAGRLISDAITTLGTGVIGTVRRVEYSYDSIGKLYQVTNYSAASGGTVINQVRREYNGLGQLVKEYQSVSGAVSTSSPVTPSVQYSYSEMDGDSNHSRITSVTYPNGRIVRYEYVNTDDVTSGLNDAISRLSFLADDSEGDIGTHLEEYSYLGAGTVIKRAHPESGAHTGYGTAGNNYSGLDKFGRVVNDGLFGYGYDANGNRLFKDASNSSSELYSYDGLNRLVTFGRGTLNGGKDGFTGSPSSSKDWTLDANGNWTNVSTEVPAREHNAQNQLTEVDGNGLSYDGNGNLTADNTGRVLAYDAWNRLVKVSNDGATVFIVAYTYDGLGRRVTEKKVSPPALRIYQEIVTNGNAPSSMVGVDGKLFFAYDNGSYGSDLWITDGTAAGTSLLTTDGSDPALLTNVNGTLYFVAGSTGHGRELWKSDGTQGGTVRVTEIVAGSGSAGITELFAIGSRLYFTANDGTNGTELWTINGTTPTMLANIHTSGSSNPGNFADVNGTLYFAATSSSEGRELWKSGGTSGTTSLVKDIVTGTGSSNPESLADLAGVLHFSADDGTNGRELWRSDGTSTYTYMLKDINASGNSAPQSMIVMGSWLYFTADNGSDGREFWRTNGTAFTTAIVANINSSGSGIATGIRPVVANSKLYFPANNGSSGTELWSSDGTSGGTAMVKNINASSASSSPAELTVVDGHVFFTATDGSHGNELWSTDGTEAGTEMIADIEPSSSGSTPTLLTAENGILYFSGVQYSVTEIMALDTRATSLYYSDQWQVLEERAGTGASISQNVWSPVYVDAMVLRDRDLELDGDFNERVYVLQDANYNVVKLFDLNGMDYTETYQYDPYGTPTVLNTGGDGVSNYNWVYLHQGGRFDEAVNLYSFRNRDYNAALGRWTQTDPLKYVDGTNLYSYLAGQPTGILDPSGTSIVGKTSEIDYYLKSIGVAANSTVSGGDSTYFQVTKDSGKNLTTEIIILMINESQVFTVSGGTAANLRLHVQARLQVVNATHAVRFGFGEKEVWESAYWAGQGQLKASVSPYDAIQAMLNSEFAGVGCQNGAWISMYAGIGNAMGKDAFDAAWAGGGERAFLRQDQRASWIPGDWGYIKNSGYTGKSIMLVGENLIYQGRGMYWGHGGGPASLPKWQRIVRDFSNNAQTTLNRKDRPSVGLDD